MKQNHPIAYHTYYFILNFPSKMLKSILIVTLAALGSLTNAAPTDNLEASADLDFGGDFNVTDGDISLAINPAVRFNLYPSTRCTGPYSTLQYPDVNCYPLPATSGISILRFYGSCRFRMYPVLH